MNIGIVTTWFERGAAYVSKQYMQLLQPENEIFIYARSGEKNQNNPEWNEGNVWWAKEPILAELTELDLKDFEEWTKKKSIDIVFFNEQWHWDVIGHCVKKGIITGAYIDYYTEATIPLFEAYDFLVCNTKRHFEAFKWHSKCYYVPWGTDTELFSPKPKPENSDKVIFFHSAGMNPYRKGTDLVIKAFNDHQILESAKLIVHTQVDLHSFFPELSSVITFLQDKGGMEVINTTVGAPGLYYLGDVYLYPSRLDGIGLTVAEALSCGLPIVVPDWPPMNEFYDDTCGRVVKIERIFARADGYYWPQSVIDLTDFQSNIKYFIENQNLLPAMKENARGYAEKALSWKNNKTELLKIFEEAKHSANNNKQINADDLFQYHEIRRGNFIKIYRKYPVAYKIKKFLFS